MLMQLLARQALMPTASHVGMDAVLVLPRLCRCVCTSSGILMNAQPQQAPRQEPEAEEQPKQSQTAAGQQQHEQRQSQQETGGAGASSSGSTEELGQKAYSAFKSSYDTFRSKIGSAAGSAARGHPHLMSAVAQEFRDVFRTADNIRSATRLYTGPVMEATAGDGTSALQLIKQEQTTWQKLQEQLSSWPLFSKLRGFKVTDTAAYKKSQETLEDLKEKYETSDHPMVHKVDEVKEKLMTGSESSTAMREVRTRDPHFDLNYFVRAIKLDAPVVVQALLHKDMETLALHLGPEMMERLGGIFKHDAERGWFEDPTILFVSDVEIVEVRMMDGDPFLVAQFHCQQLKCARDKFGNVVEGSPDAIQRMYYFWGLQQEKTGVVTADGQVLPPRWVIRDMMWQSRLALV